MKVHVVFTEGGFGPRTHEGRAFTHEIDALKEVDHRSKNSSSDKVVVTATVEIDGVKYAKEWWIGSDFRTYYESYDVTA